MSPRYEGKPNSPGLDLVWLVEQGGQGAGDGCGEGAVLVEGFGRDEDQTGVGWLAAR
jgi:hypothetical protein